MLTFDPPEAAHAAYDAALALRHPRSPHWPAVREAHLKREPFCRYCGAVAHPEVHHIEPYHLFPAVELEESNLITLCMVPGRECHLRQGHLGSWQRWNPKIRQQCKAHAPALQPLNAAAAMAATPAGDIHGWDLRVTVSGEDLLITRFDGSPVRVTCFGGDDDPMDDGATASTFNTRTPSSHLQSPGVALPMNGLRFASQSKAFHDALDFSPVPRLPWLWPVEITEATPNGRTHTFSVIDLGPAKWTGNGGDLTPAAARLFHADATARNFAMSAILRIPNGRQFLELAS